jgi:hypothetical protein
VLFSSTGKDEAVVLDLVVDVRPLERVLVTQSMRSVSTSRRLTGGNWAVAATTHLWCRRTGGPLSPIGSSLVSLVSWEKA